MLLSQVIIGLLGSFLAIWAASLIFRAVALRLEQRALRRRQAANLIPAPAPADLDHDHLVGPLAAIVLAIPIFLSGLVLVGLAVVLKEQMLNEPMANTIGGAVVIAACSLVVIAIASASAAWFFDPSRGRPRCRTCWYDLAAVIEPPSPDAPFEPVRCPECGQLTARTKDLYRTRRKPGLLWLAAIIMLVAYFTYMTPALRKGGVSAMIPSTLLIAGLDWLPDSLIVGDRTSRDCLRIRVSDRRLWTWQQQWLRRSAQELLATADDPQSLHRAITFKRNNAPVPRTHFRALIEGLLSDDPRVADMSQVILRDFVDYASRPREIDPIAVSMLPHLVPLLDHADPRIAFAAMRLISMTGPAADNHIDRITALIDIQTTRSRSAYYATLARLAVSSDAMLEALTHYCTTGTDDNRIRAIRRAHEIRSYRPELAPLFIRLTEDPSKGIVFAALVAASPMIDPDQAVTLILPRLANYNGYDRMRLLDDLFWQSDRGARYNPAIPRTFKAIIADLRESTTERLDAAIKLARFGPDPEAQSIAQSLRTALDLTEEQSAQLEEAIAKLKAPL